MKPFDVEYCPFPNSDLTSRIVLWGKDEDDVRQVFERHYPAWIFKSARSQY